MKSTLAFVQMNLRLAMRERPVLFFNYVFPLIFFFFFAQMMNASAGSITQVVTMVLVIGVLGNGLFGAGIRSVTDRETNILRRYRVAPISPLPILLASVITGWILYLPAVILLLTLAHNIYHMAVPPALLSFLLFVSLGAAVFRCIGLIIAAVANSTAESTVLVQMLYMPMLFFSGTTIPISVLPNWLQIAAQFLPSAYLLAGLQAIVLQQESILANGKAVLALSATGALALFLAMKLFRWEKEQKLPRSAKLWVLAAFLPFIVLGGYQAYSKESINKSRLLDRQMRRNHARLFRDARVFIGDGRILENTSVLVRNGKIEDIITGTAPTGKELNADVIEATGKTLLPALIDVHVHLSAPGGMYADPKEYQNNNNLDRELAAYAYSGIGTVRSVGDPIDASLSLRTRIQDGEKTGAELFACGPLFTTAGGHGTEYAKNVPEVALANFEQQFVRIPKTSAEAKQQVAELKQRGVDCIKAVMESGASGMLFNRMDPTILKAIGEAAKEHNLPLSVHTGDAQDVADALAAGASSIEHGSFRDAIPDSLLQQMAQRKISFDPTLSVGEAFTDLAQGRLDLLNRSLVQQVAPAGMLTATRKALTSAESAKMKARFAGYPVDLKLAMSNVKRASDAGVPLVSGSDAGNMMVIHGPTIQRELQLFVQAGVSTSGALQAATSNAARLLRAQDHFGSIRKGLDATLLLVDGNPLQDVSVIERISVVMLKGERIDRSDLFDQH